MIHVYTSSSEKPVGHVAELAANSGRGPSTAAEGCVGLLARGPRSFLHRIASVFEHSYDDPRDFGPAQYQSLQSIVPPYLRRDANRVHHETAGAVQPASHDGFSIHARTGRARCGDERSIAFLSQLPSRRGSDARLVAPRVAGLERCHGMTLWRLRRPLRPSTGKRFVQQNGGESAVGMAFGIGVFIVQLSPLRIQ